VGQDAVEVGVRIHEAGRQGLARRVPHLVVRELATQVGVGRDGRDLIADHPHAPARFGRLAGQVDQEVGQDDGAGR